MRPRALGSHDINYSLLAATQAALRFKCQATTSMPRQQVAQPALCLLLVASSLHVHLDDISALQHQGLFVSFLGPTMPPKIAHFINPQQSIPPPLIDVSLIALLIYFSQPSSINPFQPKSNASNQNANNHSPRLACHSLLHSLLRHCRYDLPDRTSPSHATPKANPSPTERCHVPTHASKSTSNPSQGSGS